MLPKFDAEAATALAGLSNISSPNLEAQRVPGSAVSLPPNHIAGPSSVSDPRLWRSNCHDDNVQYYYSTLQRIPFRTGNWRTFRIMASL